MATVKAFRGLRYNSEKAGDISKNVCPPYDIISEKQRLGYIENSEYNIIRLELPKGDHPYEDAGKLVREWINEGVLVKEERDAVYIYEEEFTVNKERKSVKGCIVRVKLEEFEKGIILPHENTLSKAKDDRFNLMKATDCNFSQVYALYRDEKHTVDTLIDRYSSVTPDVEITDGDGITHRLWVVTDQAAIALICADFTDRKLYIADGHHRYETALNYRNYLRKEGKAKEGDACDYQMMMLVNMEHPGLVVFPTHRIVRGLENFDADKIISACREYFDIKEISKTYLVLYELNNAYIENKKAFVMYTGGEHFTMLTLRDNAVMDKLLPDMSKASRGLDVAVLHKLVLEKLMGIDADNMAKQINLTYVKSIDEAIDAVNLPDTNCVFLLNPTKISEIADVAAAGEKMPQKSTYFYPKLVTGLVMNSFDR